MIREDPKKVAMPRGDACAAGVDIFVDRGTRRNQPRMFVLENAQLRPWPRA